MRPEDLLLRSLFQALKEKKAAWRHRELASTQRRREVENSRENREGTGDIDEEGFSHASFTLSTFSFFRSNPHFAPLPTM